MSEASEGRSSARRTNADVLRALRVAAVSAGRCLECRKRPARPGRKTCEDCTDRRRARRVRYKLIGLCECGRRPRGGFAICAKCRADHSKSARRQRSAHAAAGLCIWRSCTAPAADGRAMCGPHLIENSQRTTARNYQRLSRGECVVCGKRHPEPTWRCAGCERRVQELVKARRKAAP